MTKYMMNPNTVIALIVLVNQMRMTKKQDHVLNVVVVCTGMAMSGYVPTVITQNKTKNEKNIMQN